MTVRESARVNKGLGEEGSDTPLGQVNQKNEEQTNFQKKVDEKKDDTGR